MPKKRLIVCCDGTWNKPDQLDGGKPAPTNVTKLGRAIAPHDPSGTRQLCKYIPGVGVEKGTHWRGGIAGFGLSKNVRAAYEWLVQVYEPGDELFFVGFSRGAFTARSTVGLVRNCGILRREHADRIDEAYRLYRSHRDTTKPESPRATRYRSAYSYDGPGHETRVRFIGVWDTVGSLGIPIGGALTNPLNYLWRFHDTNLSSRVDRAFQALAIDEKRGPFKPTLWKQQDHAQGEVLEQVWFAGVHCDVGGGYRDPSLSEIPLRWMADRARSAGCAFGDEYLQPLTDGVEPSLRDFGQYIAPDACGAIHESRTRFYKWIRKHLRPLSPEASLCESLSSTADDRRQRLRGYEPPEVVKYLAGPHRITTIAL